jgi:zinc protease
MTLQEQLAKLRALSVDEVKAFHGDFYGANNATFAAVGDFDPAVLKAQVTSPVRQLESGSPTCAFRPR